MVMSSTVLNISVEISKKIHALGIKEELILMQPDLCLRALMPEILRLKVNKRHTVSSITEALSLLGFVTTTNALSLRIARYLNSSKKE